MNNPINTPDRYSPAAQIFHWLSALLVAIAWTLGTFRDAVPRGEPRGLVDFVHVSSGQMIVALLVLRLVWRVIAPAPPAGDLVTKASQLLLYALIIATAAAGLTTLFAGGKPLPLFGLGEIPSPWAKDKAFEDSVQTIHEWLANGLLALAALHAAAALRHHFRLRDGTLRRMLPRAVVD